MYEYYPELRKKFNLTASILFSALESEFTGSLHIQLSKRTLKDALGFTTSEINSAFNQLVKQYKSITQYKDSHDKFDGYLYCCYVTQGRGKSAWTTHIFRNAQLVSELLQSIELANGNSVIASSTCLSTREVEKMPGIIAGQDSRVNSDPLQSIELANGNSVIASSTCLSTREMAETIVESQQKPLQSIELANGKSVIASSTCLSGEKGHPYRDINNIIYILSLEESESVEQMNQKDQDIKNTPPTPPPLVRAVDPMKGTEKSHGSDPWMKTSNNPDPDFAKWVWKQNQLKRDTATLADAKAEIRNSWVRAQDLWEDYQSDQTPIPPVTRVVEPRPELPPASVPVFDHVAFRQKLAAKINSMEKD